MSKKGEALVLQIGNQANYVNSHIWNARLQYESNNNYYHINRNDTKSFPRCVIVESSHQVGPIYASDSDSNAYKKHNLTWEGQIHRSINSRYHCNALEHNMNVDKDSYHSSNGAKYWTDCFIPELHTKSLNVLPSWTSTVNRFDAFHKGVIGNSLNDTVNIEYLENVLESCRYFAEACDYLSTIEIYSQPHSGYAGLTTSLLPYLREEFGHSICMPIWSIDNSYRSDDSLNNASIETMKEKLHVLDTVLFYNQTLEYCNVTIPISYQSILENIPKSSLDIKNKQYTDYTAAAIAAIAIDTANVYNRKPIMNPNEQTGELYSTTTKASKYNQQLNHPQYQKQQSSSQSSSYNHNISTDDDISGLCIENTHQWCNTITNQGRFPISFLELGFPGVFHNTYNASNKTNELQNIEQIIIDSFDNYNNVNNLKSSSTSLFDDSSNYYYSMNPFTSTLSPYKISKNSKAYDFNSSNSIEQYKISSDDLLRKAYTNLISIRGCSNQALRKALYDQSQEHNRYTLTHCQLNSTPLYQANNSPFSNGDESCLDTISSMNTSPLIGKYLNEETQHWKQSSMIQALAIQLTKANMDKVECIEVTEQLLEIAQRYNN